jgi:hypothetical protein
MRLLVKRASVMLVAVVLGAAAGLAQPTIPQSQVPRDAPAAVRTQIEQLYADDAEMRSSACFKLRDMKAEGAPAVPFLIALLADDATVTVVRGDMGSQGTVGEVAGWALVGIGRSATEPLITAVQDPPFPARDRAALCLGARRPSQPAAVAPGVRFRGEAVAEFPADRAAIAYGAPMGSPPDEPDQRTRRVQETRPWLKLGLQNGRMSDDAHSGAHSSAGGDYR